MVDIQCVTAEIRQGKKKERKKKKPQDENVIAALLHRAAINIFVVYIVWLQQIGVALQVDGGK